MQSSARANTARPTFSALTDAEARAVLERNHVGRLAFLVNGQADIEPVHYVAANSWIFMRSGHGAKVEALTHRPYAAFEVDEVDGIFDWRSVVARGTVYMMSDPHTKSERADFDRALRMMRSFIAEALTPDDPTPLRQTLYGLHISALSGRRADACDSSARTPTAGFPGDRI